MKKAILVLTTLLLLAFVPACFVGCTMAEYQTNTYSVEGFSSIDIDVDVAEIYIKKSQDETGSVVCFETEKLFHTVEVVDGVLKISSNSTPSIHIGLIKPLTITISLPEGTYQSLTVETDTGLIDVSDGLTFDNIDLETNVGDITFNASALNTVKIDTDTGDISLKQIDSCTAVDLDTDTGNIVAEKINCTTFDADTDTGSIRLEDVIAEQVLTVKTNVGNIAFVKCDGKAGINITNDTGSVSGTIIKSAKFFVVDKDLARVYVPESTEGGAVVRIVTSVGSVNLTFAE